jgi:hypothetical protein
LATCGSKRLIGWVGKAEFMPSEFSSGQKAPPFCAVKLRRRGLGFCGAARIAVVFLSCLFLRGTLPAQAPERLDLNPIQFTAAILAKIPPYIEWPANAFSGPEEPLIIGLLDSDETLLTLLTHLLEGQRIHGRNVMIKAFPSVEAIERCHLLYVSEQLRRDWHPEGAPLPGLLTVGESPEFIRDGGIFNLSTADRKLEVHLNHARQAGIKINSKLLRISRIIK